MKAATPPRRWASAMTCWQIVVLPDDSGPKISVIRPRGMPPTPSARSSAIEPVGITSIAVIEWAPSFMIEPVPNCFSIAWMAAATALPRSAWARSAARSPPFRSSVVRSPVNAMSPSRSCRSVAVPTGHAPGRDPRRSAFVGRLFLGDPSRLPFLPDQLRLHRRRLRKRRQLRAGPTCPSASSSLRGGDDLESPSMLLRVGTQATERPFTRTAPRLHCRSSGPRAGPDSAAQRGRSPDPSAARILTMKSRVKVRL